MVATGDRSALLHDNSTMLKAQGLISAEEHERLMKVEAKVAMLNAELQQWEGLHQQRLEEAGDGEEEDDDLFSEVSRRLSSFASGDNVTEEVGEAEAAKEEGAATAAAEDEEGAEEEDDIFSFRRLSTFFDGTGEEVKDGEADEAEKKEEQVSEESEEQKQV